MPRLISSLPKYRLHRASGQAVVTLSGTDIYLGPWHSKASRIEYDRVIGEWVQNGRRLARGNSCDLAVVEIINAYCRHADAYYVKDGRRTREAELITAVLVRFVQPRYGRTNATEFGPCALKAVRQEMIEAGHSRGYINKNVERIRRMFRWAASEEMVPVAVPQALATVNGLRKGRTTAREPVPVPPVADEVVKATLPYLPPVVADMVRFHRLTGCRPGEVCQLRPMDLDRSKDVWAYRPASHKTEHYGRERIVFVGPKAQAVLLPYLLRDAIAYCFSPAESEAKRHAEMREQRKSRVQPSQRNRCMARPSKAPKTQYTKDSYNRAIQRGILKANRKREDEAKTNKTEVQPVPHWHANQLRHSAATEIRSRYGLEAAQAVLGHSRADVTQVYAERDQSLAARIMRETG